MKFRIFVTLMLITITFSLSQSGIKVDWCNSGIAKQLRQRNPVEPAVSTIHNLPVPGSDSQIAIYAHRGGRHCEEMDGAPENSIPNVKRAINMGFDGYEADLWPISNEKFLIHHDQTLERTTTGSGTGGRSGTSPAWRRAPSW